MSEYRALGKILEALNFAGDVNEDVVLSKSDEIKDIIAKKKLEVNVDVEVEVAIEENEEEMSGEYDDSIVFEDEFHVKEPEPTEDENKEMIFGSDEEIVDEAEDFDVDSVEEVVEPTQEDSIPEPTQDDMKPEFEGEVEQPKGQSASEFTFEEMKDLIDSLTITEKMDLMEAIQTENEVDESSSNGGINAHGMYEDKEPVDEGEGEGEGEGVVEEEEIEEADANDFPESAKKEIEISANEEETYDDSLAAIKNGNVEYKLVGRNVSKEHRTQVLKFGNLGERNLGFVITRPGVYVESKGKRLNLNPFNSAYHIVDGDGNDGTIIGIGKGSELEAIYKVDLDGKDSINFNQEDVDVVVNGESHPVQFVYDFENVKKEEILGVVIPEEGFTVKDKVSKTGTEKMEITDKELPDFNIYEPKGSSTVGSIDALLEYFTNASPEEVFDVYLITDTTNDLEIDKGNYEDKFVPKHKKIKNKVEDSIDNTEERIIERAAQIIANKLV